MLFRLVESLWALKVLRIVAPPFNILKARWCSIWKVVLLVTLVMNSYSRLFIQWWSSHPKKYKSWIKQGWHWREAKVQNWAIWILKEPAPILNLILVDKAQEMIRQAALRRSKEFLVFGLIKSLKNKMHHLAVVMAPILQVEDYNSQIRLLLKVLFNNLGKIILPNSEWHDLYVMTHLF